MKERNQLVSKHNDRGAAAPVDNCRICDHPIGHHGPFSCAGACMINVKIPTITDVRKFINDNTWLARDPENETVDFVPYDEDGDALAWYES